MEKESQLTNCGVLDARTAFFMEIFSFGVHWLLLAVRRKERNRVEGVVIDATTGIHRQTTFATPLGVFL